MTDAPAYAGIDVAKDRLDVVLRPGGEYVEATNDERGVESVVSCLREENPALTACMRKLLTILAAVLRNRTPWRTDTIVA